MPIAELDGISGNEAAGVERPVPLTPSSLQGISTSDDMAARIGGAAARSAMSGIEPMLADIAATVDSSTAAVAPRHADTGIDPSENPDGDRAAGRREHMRNDLMSE